MNIDEKKKIIARKTREYLKRKNLSEEDGVKIGFMRDDESIGKIKAVKTGIVPLDIVAGNI